MPQLERDSIRINVVTDVPEALLRRQEPAEDRNKWVYSDEPTDADLHVVYGLVRSLRFTNKAAPRYFVAVEPPEIFEYDLRALSNYDTVLAGAFPYLAGLSNMRVASGLLNWHAGIDFSANPPAEKMSLKALVLAANQPRSERVSVITSLKVMTPMQRRRIQFVEYLQRHMPELDVYGRDTRPVGDKAEVLLASRYHLALENNAHPYYWTEKLADPVLCGCHVFYAGAEPLDPEFDRNGISEVNLDDFDASYRHMSDRLALGHTDSGEAAIAHNRDFLTKTANLHARINQLVDAAQTEYPVGRQETIPSHRVASRERVRFLRERLRTARRLPR